MMLEGIVEDFLDEVFPGGALVVFRKDGVIHEEYFGSLEIGGEQVDSETMYDVASLTKVVITAPLVLKMVEIGKLSLQSRIGDFFEELKDDWKGSLRVFDLLTHTSGLPPYVDLTSVQNPREYVSKIFKSYETGKSVVYSCMGYIILGFLLEKITGRSLNDLAKEYIFKPAGMKRSSYNPKSGKIAPTTFKGVVHDPNARALGGVSGNAGLFSTAEDLANFMIAYINGRIIHQSIVDLAIKDFTPSLEDHRGLGWKVKMGLSEVFPEIISDGSFGHTGYTGTYLWYDPKKDCGAALFTNRVNISDTQRSKSLMNEFRRRAGNKVIVSCL